VRREEEEEEEEEEEFFNHYKNDLKRHAHTPSELSGKEVYIIYWNSYAVFNDYSRVLSSGDYSLVLVSSGKEVVSSGAKDGEHDVCLTCVY
jgi:hypothetical protein